MRIISWNVHFDITAKQYNHIQEKKPDILIIEECHVNGFNLVQKDWTNTLYYNDQLYDNNPKADNKNMYGIAVFSNKYRFEFTDTFNRNLRYVVPLKVFDVESNVFLFNLFVVWTKKEPIAYVNNIVKAFEFAGYSDYLKKERSLFIGDFNTPATKENRESYDKLLKLGLFDCAKPEDILIPTYSHKTEKDFYTADYCFINEEFKKSDLYLVNETIFDFDENEKSKDKYMGLSDHVPLLVEITKKE